jgi:hypothetical protein
MSARKTEDGMVVLLCDVCAFAETVPCRPSRVVVEGWSALDDLGEQHECPECRICGVADPSRNVPGPSE